MKGILESESPDITFPPFHPLSRGRSEGSKIVYRSICIARVSFWPCRGRLIITVTNNDELLHSSSLKDQHRKDSTELRRRFACLRSDILDRPYSFLIIDKFNVVSVSWTPAPASAGFGVCPMVGESMQSLRVVCNIVRYRTSFVWSRSYNAVCLLVSGVCFLAAQLRITACRGCYFPARLRFVVWMMIGCTAAVVA